MDWAGGQTSSTGGPGFVFFTLLNMLLRTGGMSTFSVHQRCVHATTYCIYLWPRCCPEREGHVGVNAQPGGEPHRCTLRLNAGSEASQCSYPPLQR
jgi:hypothetical protein